MSSFANASDDPLSVFSLKSPFTIEFDVHKVNLLLPAKTGNPSATPRFGTLIPPDLSSSIVTISCRADQLFVRVVPSRSNDHGTRAPSADDERFSNESVKVEGTENTPEIHWTIDPSEALLIRRDGKWFAISHTPFIHSVDVTESTAPADNSDATAAEFILSFIPLIGESLPGLPLMTKVKADGANQYRVNLGAVAFNGMLSTHQDERANRMSLMNAKPPPALNAAFFEMPAMLHLESHDGSPQSCVVDVGDHMAEWKLFSFKKLNGNWIATDIELVSYQPEGQKRIACVRTTYHVVQLSDKAWDAKFFTPESALTGSDVVLYRADGLSTRFQFDSSRGDLLDQAIAQHRRDTGAGDQNPGARKVLASGLLVSMGALLLLLILFVVVMRAGRKLAR